MQDLSYLMRDSYDDAFNKTLRGAAELHTLNDLNAASGDVKVLVATLRACMHLLPGCWASARALPGPDCCLAVGEGHSQGAV